MASTCILMAVVEYPQLLCFRHTFSDYLISTIFIQEEFFLIIRVSFCKEKLLVLRLPICWYFTYCQVISNVGIPGCVFN